MDFVHYVGDDMTEVGIKKQYFISFIESNRIKDRPIFNNIINKHPAIWAKEYSKKYDCETTILFAMTISEEEAKMCESFISMSKV